MTRHHPPPVHLTRRERELIELVVRGMSNRRIAHELGLSVQTVKNRLTVVFEKLHVCNRVELAVAALRTGIAD